MTGKNEQIMAEYIAFVSFTAIGTAAEHAFIEILPPANVSILIKRIKVTWGTPETDNTRRIRLRRTSTVMGGTTTTRTPNALRPDAPSSVSTVTVKNATTITAPGTNVDLVLDTSINGQSSFEWIARDWRDYIESGINQRLCLSITPSTAAGSNAAELTWEE